MQESPKSLFLARSHIPDCDGFVCRYSFFALFRDKGNSVVIGQASDQKALNALRLVKNSSGLLKLSLGLLLHALENL